MTIGNNPIEAGTSSAILTPADFADTGQWRLIIHVASDCMGAVLRHVSDTSRPAVRLFADYWEPLEGRDLLKRIENEVYDHPAILDDYATEIVVTTPKTTWIPTEIMSAGDFAEERVFSEFFPGEEIMADKIGEATALFSLTDGFDGFMARTLPGARIRSHLAVLAERTLACASKDLLIINLILYRESLLLVVVRDNMLLCAAEHPLTDRATPALLLKYTLEAFGEDGEGSIVNIFDFKGDTRSTQELLSQAMDSSHAKIRELPEKLIASGLPPAMVLTVFKEIPLPSGFF